MSAPISHSVQELSQSLPEIRQAERKAIAELLHVLRCGDIGGRGVADCVERWQAVTANGPVELRLTGEAVYVGAEEIHRAKRLGEVIPGRLHAQGVVGLVLEPGLGDDEATRMLAALGGNALNHKVDFALRLWEADLVHLRIQLNEAETTDVMTDVAGLAFTERNREAILAAAREPKHAPAQQRALAILHEFALQPLGVAEGDNLEQATVHFTRQLIATADLAAIHEMFMRCEDMRSERIAVRTHIADATMSAAHDVGSVVAFLEALEEQPELESHTLARCLERMGPHVATPFVQWLIRTQHRRAGKESLAALGPDAERAVVELYGVTEGPRRSRLRTLLLELDTHDALAAISSESEALIEAARLRIMEVGERSGDPAIRSAVVRGMTDKSGRVRRAPHKGQRRTHAEEVGTMIEEILSADDLHRRMEGELDQLFESLARIADARIAEAMVDFTGAKGIKARFRKPSPLQAKCTRALRGMNGPEARQVIDRLRAKAPRAYRDLLDGGFGSL